MYLTKRFNVFNENVRPFLVICAMFLGGLYYYYRLNKELVMRCGVYSITCPLFSNVRNRTRENNLLSL